MGTDRADQPASADDLEAWGLVAMHMISERMFENEGSALELPPGAIGPWTPMNRLSFRMSFKCSSALSVAPVQLGVWGSWLPQGVWG